MKRVAPPHPWASRVPQEPPPSSSVAAWISIDGRTYAARRPAARHVARYERLSGRGRDFAADAGLLYATLPWRFSFLVYGNPVSAVLRRPPAVRHTVALEVLAWARGGDVPQFPLTAAVSCPQPVDR